MRGFGWYLYGLKTCSDYALFHIPFSWLDVIGYLFYLFIIPFHSPEFLALRQGHFALRQPTPFSAVAESLSLSLFPPDAWFRQALLPPRLRSVQIDSAVKGISPFLRRPDVTAAVLMAVALSPSVKGEREEAVPAQDDLLPQESQQLAVVAKDDLQASATGQNPAVRKRNHLSCQQLFPSLSSCRIRRLRRRKLPQGTRRLRRRKLPQGHYGGSHYDQGGYKGHQGYHADKGHKGSHYGDHGKAHYSGYHGDHGKHYKGHDDKHKYYGDAHSGKKGGKGHQYGSKGHHNKGHKDKGFKNVYHKEEYGHTKKFYDDSDNKKYHNNYDDLDTYFKAHKGSDYKGGHYKGGHHHDAHGHKGHHEKGKYHDDHAGHDGHYGDKGHYGHKSSYGDHGGHKAHYGHDDHKGYGHGGHGGGYGHGGHGGGHGGGYGHGGHGGGYGHGSHGGGYGHGSGHGSGYGHGGHGGGYGHGGHGGGYGAHSTVQVVHQAAPKSFESFGNFAFAGH
nr:keratin, type I cytoskeletal 9-like [Penaeus vannamei]